MNELVPVDQAANDTTQMACDPPAAELPPTTSQPTRRSLLTCTVAVIITFGCIDWLIFHGGCAFVTRVAVHVGTDVWNALAIAATWAMGVWKRIDGVFEAWRRFGLSHTEAMVWIIGAPTLLGLCHGVRAKSDKGFACFAAGLFATYFSLFVCLSDAGAAALGFGFRIIWIIGAVIFLAVLCSL